MADIRNQIFLSTKGKQIFISLQMLCIYIMQDCELLELKMEPFGNWVGGHGGGSPDKQQLQHGEMKFDASQYAFFGKYVVEHDLGELDQSMEDARSMAAKDEDYPSASDNKRGEGAISPSSADHLATAFTKLNTVGQPRSPTETTAPVNYRRRNGTIKWYDNERGYGFITPNGGGLDVFVHNSSLKSDGFIHVWPGAHVEYELVSGQNSRIQAINVTAPNGKLLQDSRKVGRGGGGGEASICTTHPTSGSSNMGGMGLQAVIKANGCNGNHRSGNGVGPCFSCGYWGHLSKDCCFAAGNSYALARCCLCSKMGHFANNCPHQT